MSSTDAPQAPPGPPRSATAAFVVAQIRPLQDGYVAERQTAASRAGLAQLRRGVGRPFDAVPEIFEYLVDPTAPTPRTDDPTPHELAIHTALTLYALHQQSQPKRMHTPRTSFGTALGYLRFTDGTENPGVVRRFQAMGTAATFDDLVQHARSLVALLRAAGCGFDYGRFTDDLVAFQNPARTDSVRLRWGRDFYRVAATETLPDDSEEL